MNHDLSTETLSKFVEIRETSHATSLLKTRTEQWIERALALIFPQFCLKIDCNESAVQDDLSQIWSDFERLEGLVGYQALSLSQAADELLRIREVLLTDAQAALDGDPAATSIDEVVIAYPSFRALAHYRIAHTLQRKGYPLIPRIITEKAHRETGIDIHPGAEIGPYCFIDHGTGVVVGETAIVGSHVKIYQGVTLGALSVSKDLANTKRHPTVEDHVVIYANATILGGNTVIGANSVVGGNSWVTASIPPNTTTKRQP
ncbi:MAG: serine acetyltransferase [Armatimonadetes bacterium]|nr:serine acetyltransferase [Armatimonadota bacterium]